MARKRTLKVSVSKDELGELSDEIEVLEHYEGFVSISASPDKVRGLARKYPVEDITDQYSVHISGRRINTGLPHIDVRGKVHSHSAYRNVKRLSPGAHHYLVQFIGPIKSRWLTRLRRMGADPREPYENFTYVVRCDDSVLKEVAAQRFVRWVGHLPHAARLQLGDAGKRLPRTRIMENVYRIELFSEKNAQSARSALRKLDVKLLKSGGNKMSDRDASHMLLPQRAGQGING